MDQALLNQLVNQGYTLKDIAKKTKVSQSTVRYWLKVYNLKTHRGPHGKHLKELIRTYSCSCGESNPEKFYGNKNTICSKCHNAYTLKVGQEKRLRAIKYLGGKCKICGYNKYSSGLAFHHRDPSTKDPDFSGLRGWAWEKIVQEIDKCDLLCVRCHNEVHEEWKQRDVA